MATVTTNLTIEPSRIPYISPSVSPAFRNASVLPFAELRAVVNETIAATGAGDNQRLVMNIELQPNFAYVLLEQVLDLSMNVAGGSVNFGDRISSRFNNTDNEILAYIPTFSRGAYVFASSNREGKTYYSERIPQVILDDVQRIQFDLYNQTANDGAYTLQYYARILQFGVEQALHWVVNTPVLTR